MECVVTLKLGEGSQLTQPPAGRPRGAAVHCPSNPSTNWGLMGTVDVAMVLCNYQGGLLRREGEHKGSLGKHGRKALESCYSPKLFGSTFCASDTCSLDS